MDELCRNYSHKHRHLILGAQKYLDTLTCSLNELVLAGSQYSERPAERQRGRREALGDIITRCIVLSNNEGTLQLEGGDLHLHVSFVVAPSCG